MLGLFFSSKFEWNSHIAFVAKTASNWVQARPGEPGEMEHL